MTTLVAKRYVAIGSWATFAGSITRWRGFGARAPRSVTEVLRYGNRVGPDAGIRLPTTPAVPRERVGHVLFGTGPAPHS
jgi:hypothetical protein